ncbi:hypothetical protein [Nesterenkonia alkaliphila]|uniref:Asparagine synthetase domain-containing protein n=1 Tax=Nesterenkonia alkaliphila TaxID=1463631 RepID=A0A7K1UID6_9MICC|nr:hypothetical protein [Nesterenkonia alkaliphila]MVT26235.1 hypothetical protein [Nesterenkonia alkaliphila]GFZ84629.1 hypothetical protein GCM10011359_12050 [Nesterenkonia alkaliphila]
MPDNVRDEHSVDLHPAAPKTIPAQPDFSHLRYARGYVLHPENLSPDVPSFWRERTFAGRTFRWDPRVTLAVASSGDHEVLLCGHALDPNLATTDLGRIAAHLLEALRSSRDEYLDILEEMFGQFVVLDRVHNLVRAQTDAIASRSIFHDEQATLISSHVNLVGRTLKRKPSRFTKWLSQPKNQDFPGRTTPYESVWLLTPNTELELGTGEVTRIGPRPYEPLTVEQAADLMQPVLEKQVEVLLESSRKIVVSASAGIDSRSSLAAFAGASGKESVEVFTYTKALGSGRQSRELHRDKLAATMSADLGLPHQMFDLNTAEKPPKEYVEVLRELSSRRSNTVISWVYHSHLPHDSLHIRGQINGVGKWHFATMLHFSESLELSARRMASLTKRGKDADRPLDDSWWELGEEAFQEYIDTTQLRSVPSGYRMTDLFLWEHRVANWNHAHIVESDVTFDTYQLFGSRRMIRLMLSVPELDRVQLTLFRELIRRMEPRLLEYPLNGKQWEEPTYDLPLSAYQSGTTRTWAEVQSLRKRISKANSLLKSRRQEIARLKKKLAQAESESLELREQLESRQHDDEASALQRLKRGVNGVRARFNR